MLVAINPYEILPIYTNNEITNYRNRKIGDLPPHIFAIGDSAFQEILRENIDQCIVISGESGMYTLSFRFDLSHFMTFEHLLNFILLLKVLAKRKARN